MTVMRCALGKSSSVKRTDGLFWMKFVNLQTSDFSAQPVRRTRLPGEFRTKLANERSSASGFWIAK
jgi:hypothetical protein